MKAGEFKKKNMKAKADHDKKHHSHAKHEGSGCCGELTRYYIPRSEMSSVDRAIDDRLNSEMYFKENLK